MFNIVIKLLVSKLHNLFLLVALTGFVCTYKIQAEEECLSSNILCYECDSRYDPNCADPFEMSSSSLADQQAARNSTFQNNDTNQNGDMQHRQQTADSNIFAGSDSGRMASFNMTKFKPKKMPNVVVCHGCCVKITSKTPDGATYVKRTCTTNLQINYFMVGLVCMKESGDRGKMCFCETDYCNGQPSNRRPAIGLIASLLTIIALLVTAKLSTTTTTTTLAGRILIEEHIHNNNNNENNNNSDKKCINEDSCRDGHHSSGRSSCCRLIPEIDTKTLMMIK